MPVSSVWNPRPSQVTALPLTPARIRREAVLTGLVSFAISAGVLVVMYRVAQQALLHQIRNQLRDVAALAATTLDTRPGGGVLAPGAPQGAAYRRATEPLLRLRRSVPDLYYAYTLAPSPAGFRFGVDSSAFITNPGDDLTAVAQPGELYAEAPPATAEAFQSGRVTVSSIPYTDKWGTFLSAFAPLRDSSGQVVGLLGVDLSLARLNGYLRPLHLTLELGLAGSAGLATALGIGRWRSLRAQAGAIREIEATSRAKSSFLALISHEIRTPLNGVLGLSDILLGTSLTQPQRRCLETLRSSGDALLQLLSGLLDVTHLEAGTLQVERERFALRPLLEEEVERLRPQAEGQGLTLELGLDPSLPDTLVSDPQRLRQILRHLLGNALKVSARGRVTVEVAVPPAGDGTATLEIAVRDSGPGLSAEECEQIFQLFSPLDASPTRRQEGMGMGLALSRGLATALGASITVRSTPGTGSSFSLHLPLAAASPAPPEPSDKRGQAAVSHRAAQPAAGGAAATPQALRILLAEDNAVNARVCTLMLQRLGYTASLARDGVEAVAADERLDPDLILMDLRMPQVDGLEATRRIRARQGQGTEGRRPWIIALTANTQPSDREAALESGMDDFLAKPILLEDLRMALDRAQVGLRVPPQDPPSR